MVQIFKVSAVKIVFKELRQVVTVPNFGDVSRVYLELNNWRSVPTFIVNINEIKSSQIDLVLF